MIKKYTVHELNHPVLLRGIGRSEPVLYAIFNQILLEIVGQILAAVVRAKILKFRLIGI